MHKLMSANVMRLRKDMVFWVCTAAMAIIGTAIALMTGGSEPEAYAIDKTFFIYPIPLEFACAIFSSLFIGADYGDGTIRNKVIVGHTRTAIYASNLCTCAIAGLSFGLAYIMPMLTIGIPRLGLFEMGPAAALLLVGITIALMLAVCAIFTLVSMLCQNRAIVAVLCLVGLLAMFFVGAWLNSRLNEPEYYDSFVYTDNTGSMAEAPAERNPNYLQGAKRDVFQCLLELLPAGQALIFADMSFVHTWQLPLYSLLVAILTTFAGLVVFRKKDLR